MSCFSELEVLLRRQSLSVENVALVNTPVARIEVVLLFASGESLVAAWQVVSAQVVGCFGVGNNIQLLNIPLK